MELFIGLFLMLAVIAMAIVLWRGEPGRKPGNLGEEHEDSIGEQFEDNQN